MHCQWIEDIIVCFGEEKLKSSNITVFSYGGGGGGTMHKPGTSLCALAWVLGFTRRPVCTRTLEVHGRSHLPLTLAMYTTQDRLLRVKRLLLAFYILYLHRLGGIASLALGSYTEKGYW